MPFVLPRLSCAYDALEPHIDAKTMEIHHTKHHQTYVDKLNAAVSGRKELEGRSLEQLLTLIEQLPPEIRTAVRNHGGGHANHSLFWTIMAPDGRREPTGELADQLRLHFGGFEGFKQAFTAAALGRFGSGWAWLSLGGDKRLMVEDTANQDSPLMVGHTPILGIDVWEHAYYLKYQHRRADYVEAFYRVIDWDAVAQRYQQALKSTVFR